MESKKRLSINSKYKSILSFDDYSISNDILIYYYLPLLRPEAFSLYLFLSLDARNNMINTIFISIERLISILNLSIQNIEKAISRLELLNLIEIFIDEEDENRFIFNLKKPLSPNNFNKSTQMVELLKSSIGEESLQINNKNFNSMKETSIEGFKITTEEISLMLSEETNIAKLNVNYNFDSIKNVLNSRNINWSEFWTKEFENKLLDLVIIYKISSFDIAIEIINELENGKFNLENFESRIKTNFKSKNNLDQIIDLSEIDSETKLNFLKEFSVKDFFIHRLNRVPTNSEEKMIVKLFNKYGFNDFKINILLDYSIIINDGAINKNYIFRISDTLLKENINTGEKIINYLKTSYKIKKNKTNNSSDINLKKEMKDKPIF